MKAVDFNRYKTTACTYREVSVYKSVPIQLLSEFRRIFGAQYRVRYRGKRIEFRRLDGRTMSQCRQDCLKARAEYFSAY